jgi:lysophospholipase L1-like esterase
MSALPSQADAKSSNDPKQVRSGLLFVGNRSMMLSSATGGGGAKNGHANYTHAESFYVSTNGPVAVRGIQLTYANYALVPDEHKVSVNNPIAIEAAISVAGGIPRRVTFGRSAAQKIMIPMERDAVSNTIPVIIPPYATFVVRTGLYVAPGQTWPVGMSNYDHGDNAVASVDQTSHVMSLQPRLSVPNGGLGGQLGYGPVSIVGLYDGPEIAIASLGDSLTTGNTGAGSGNGRGDRGSLPYGYAEASSGRIAYSKLARDSAFLKSFTKPELVAHRLQQINFATHVVVWLGTNDVGANSVEMLKSCLTSIWSKARERGRTVIAVTLPPRTNSSDRFTTEQGQIPRKDWQQGGKRDELNAWIKAQAGVLVDDVLDFNPIWESAMQPGIWAPGLTGDGTHPNEKGMQAVKSMVSAAGNRWRLAYLANNQARPTGLFPPRDATTTSQAGRGR